MEIRRQAAQHARSPAGLFLSLHEHRSNFPIKLEHAGIAGEGGADLRCSDAILDLLLFAGVLLWSHFRRGISCRHKIALFAVYHGVGAEGTTFFEFSFQEKMRIETSRIQPVLDLAHRVQQWTV